jgi:hypothetical protein
VRRVGNVLPERRRQSLTGEIVALRREDVDLLRGIVHIRLAVKDIRGHLIEGDTKNQVSGVISGNHGQRRAARDVRQDRRG